jgi:LuxR family maltose regulon positive regulatory protein
MTLPLLSTKLYIPSLRPELVPRPRLIERLDAGLDRKLTLISAPAGYGKTTLLSEWIASCGRRVAWLSLDEHDNDPTRFWMYVCAAVCGALPKVSGAFQAMLAATPQPAIETVLTALINELAGQSSQIVLVLDDYQMIKTQSIHAGLAFLLDYLPPQMHLGITTRIDPPLNLARLRIQQQMTELRASDLRFTSEETAAFLNQVMKLALTPTDVARLEARTEGWIAGLQATAMAIQNQDDVSGFIAAFAGSHRYILSYLIEEVLQRQPEHIQSFLLQTCVLERLCGSLCDAVCSFEAGDGRNGHEILEHLEKTNLFIVPLDDEQRWYRYHHLFSDMLHARLKHAYSPKQIHALHRRASEWYAAHGLVSEAIKHALAAQNSELAAQLIEQHAEEVFQRYELTTLLSWIKELPPELVKSRLRLNMISGWALLATGQMDESEKCMCDVERAVGATADALMADPAARTSLAPETVGALVEATAIRLSQAIQRLDFSLVLELAGQILPYLDDDTLPCPYNSPATLRPTVLFPMAVAYECSGQIGTAARTFAEAAALAREQDNHYIVLMATGHLAQLQVVQGRLRDAERMCQDTLEWGNKLVGSSAPTVGIAHVALGNLRCERNDLQVALTHLQKGIALLKPWRYRDGLLPGYIGLARTKRAQGDWDGAFAAIDELAESCSGSEALFILPTVAAFRASLWIARGSVTAAAEWVASSGLSADDEPFYFQEYLYLVLARVLLAQGNLTKATQLLARLRTAAETGKRTGRLIEVLVLQALTLRAQGKQAEALTALRRALTLAAPEEYVRLFMDEGQAMVDLLNGVVDQLSPADQRYVHRLLAAYPDSPVSPSRPRPPTVQQSTLIEPLSERELELLRLIATGMTNRAIADKLMVSVNTVKTHARNIYGKLGVRNRTEATSRARDLELI